MKMTSTIKISSFVDFWIANVTHTNLFIFKIYDLFSFESIAKKIRVDLWTYLPNNQKKMKN